MGDGQDRCVKCGHLLEAHVPGVGCTDRVPGTMERMPGTCDCGAPEVLADVLPFRSRDERDAARATSPIEEGP